MKLVSPPPPFPRLPITPRIRSARWLLALLCGSLGLLRLAAGEPTPMHVGFSSSHFENVNENDMLASLKGWAETISRECNVPISSRIPMISSVPQMIAELQAGRLDALSASTPEYWAIRQQVPIGPIVMAHARGRPSEEYLVLVHRDSPYQSLADLRGKKIGYLTGSRAAVAGIWLETQLLEKGLGRADTFWGPVVRSTKLTAVLLPVFFQQNDACLVTRNGFATMCELNPQVGRQLRILLQSPPYCPVVFFFRGNYHEEARDRLLSQLSNITRTAAGQQALALFQTDDMAEHPASDLDPTCALLEHHRELLALAPPSVSSP